MRASARCEYEPWHADSRSVIQIAASEDTRRGIWYENVPAEAGMQRCAAVGATMQASGCRLQAAFPRYLSTSCAPAVVQRLLQEAGQ